MKKTTLILVAVLLVLGTYFYFDARSSHTTVPGFSSEDEKIVNAKSMSFLEDLKYKDFKKAATYHSPEDQKKANIPKLIQRVFLVKPELLDIMEYRILDTDFDSTGDRARVKIKSKVHVLNTEEIRNPEAILYYHKQNGQWYMELESSLH